MTKKELLNEFHNAVDYMADDLIDAYLNFLSERDDEDKEYYSDVSLYLRFLLDTAAL